MKKTMFIMLFASTVTLSGCGVHNVKNIWPNNYQSATKYASDLIEGSGCIGKIDDLFFSAGYLYVNDYGLNYSSDNAGLHCSKSSFIDSMSRFCESKSGFFSGRWCSVNDNPLFEVDGFTILERAPSQSYEAWLKSSRRRGYESKRDQILKEEEKQHKEAEARLQKLKIMNSEVAANVGDTICREDYEAKPYQYPGVAHYKAYVEKKEKNRLQVRLIWHGGENFIVNDLNELNNLIWITPKGWWRCN